MILTDCTVTFFNWDAEYEFNKVNPDHYFESVTFTPGIHRINDQKFFDLNNPFEGKKAKELYEASGNILYESLSPFTHNFLKFTVQKVNQFTCDNEQPIPIKDTSFPNYLTPRPKWIKDEFYKGKPWDPDSVFYKSLNVKKLYYNRIIYESKNKFFFLLNICFSHYYLF